MPGPVVRVSAGRFGEVRDLQRSDVELLGVLAADFSAATGVLARPVEASLRRWGGGLPQYTPGHLDRVAALRASLPEGLAVAGAAWDGVGVPACLRSGAVAAETVLAALAGGHPADTGDPAGTGHPTNTEKETQ
jgi:oxygen-dependent protoporphyrinogen oxidase